MKVRWTENSIRLRITPSELEALDNNQIVREAVRLAGGSWTARVLPGCANTDVGLVDGDLLVYLSAADLHTLLNPEEEGVYFSSETAGSHVINVCIEKDFPCAHPRASAAREPASECFPPNGAFRQRQAAESASAH
jgi:hypothetical protein